MTLAGKTSSRAEETSARSGTRAGTETGTKTDARSGTRNQKSTAPGSLKKSTTAAHSPEPTHPGLTLHVVSHTHWDREWYLTYQQFRMRLVEVIDNVLHTLDTRPSFRYFHLDGQTIVLEDYLQIRPQNEARIRKYVKEGRLLIGPWYQLMDEYLVSGESIIRSLLIGQRIARDFGASMPIGYLADQFGNISQMPQIFCGFGMDNCIFGRGLQLVGDRTVEFNWRGPDGSEVVCSLMAWWYNNAQRLPRDPEQAAEYASRLASNMAPRCASGQLLLMNGVDHLDVQEDVAEIIDSIADAVPNARVIHSTLPGYMRAVQDAGLSLPLHEGEMREDRHGSILAGVLSTRLYLKQANSECETLLEKVAEPLASLAWLHGYHYDRDFLKHAWKRLMWNHPHDSICGCSVDQVHREMMPRFDEVAQITEELASRAVHGLAARIDSLEPCLVVFNTLGFERTDLVEATVDFPLGQPTREGKRPPDAGEARWFALWDDEGNEVCYQISDVETTTQTIISPVELPLIQWLRRFHIKFIADEVAPLGYRTYRIDTTRGPARGRSLAPYANAMENESLLVEILQDGSLHILQKSTEQDYEGCNAFEDGGDCGDEYHYVPPIRDEVICTARTASAHVSLVESGPVVTTYRVELDLSLPRGLSSDHRGRSRSQSVTRVTSLVSLAACASRVEISTTIDNQSRDHRLRALFPTGLNASAADAEGQFDVISRPICLPPDWVGAAQTRPQQSFVDVSNGADGLCILNRGLPEYELLGDEEDTLALTLLRCVGRLSATGDGPPTPTPDAQCPGLNQAEYAIYPHAGRWLDARAWQEAQAFRTPLRCVQKGAAYRGELDILQRQQWRMGDPVLAGRGTQTAPLPGRHSYLRVAPDQVVVSALKLAEDRESLIVRVYNIGTEAVPAYFIFGFPVQEVYRLNLDEARQEKLPHRGAEIEIELRGREIATLEVVTG